MVMPERKEIVHYCAKCGKGMKYKEKKMIYLYDVKTIDYLGFGKETPKKRMAINLCEKCADELEKLIDKWKGGAYERT